MANRVMTPGELVHYQALIGDIRESKADQWRISNYGLLAQAAIASIFSSAKSNASYGDTIEFHLLFVVIIVVICLTTRLLILDSWWRIIRSRTELRTFSPLYRENDESHTSTKREIKALSLTRDSPLVRLFVGVQFIGVAMSLLYIFLEI